MKDKKVPSHVVIIPDGNRRWAKERSKLTVEGHYRGYERVEELITEAKNCGVKYLTVWAFSTENWSRSEEEVSHLLKLIHKGLKALHNKAHAEKARFIHLGRKDRLGNEILTLISLIEEETKDYRDFCLCMAIDYGGEDEMKRAEEKLRLSNDDTLSVLDFLDTTLHSIPSPDFIIRTSGEYRTSGFMPLQTLYSEWYFENCNFPDFDTQAFHRALEAYHLRERRLGK